MIYFKINYSIVDLTFAGKLLNKHILALYTNNNEHQVEDEFVNQILNNPGINGDKDDGTEEVEEVDDLSVGLNSKNCKTGKEKKKRKERMFCFFFFT